jgi:hypothetical protein
MELEVRGLDPDVWIRGIISTFICQFAFESPLFDDAGILQRCLEGSESMEKLNTEVLLMSL